MVDLLIRKVRALADLAVDGTRHVAQLHVSDNKARERRHMTHKVTRDCAQWPQGTKYDA